MSSSPPSITFAAPSVPDTGTLVVGVSEGRRLSPTAEKVDAKSSGALSRAIEASRFRGKKEEVLEILAPAGLKLDRVVCVGLGDPKAIGETQAQRLGGVALAHLNRVGVKSAAVAIDAYEGAESPAVAKAANFAFGALLRSYRFDRYRTKEGADKKPTLRTVRILVQNAGRARTSYAQLAKVADGVFFTRDLVSEPANVLYPESFAKQAESLKELGVQVETLGPKEMQKLGMNALLGVGQGSAHESRLVVMQWKGAGRSKKVGAGPVAFVGKGVTFDTGGISIKPSAGMEDMKWDMGGAGVVVGLMKALAGRKAKVNAVGVIGLTENMPSGTAQRPGDIVTSMSGQTIEVLNTDAEGRLVLADALWYCQDRFKPAAMIDLATLTGAIIVCLGSEHAGLFSNNDELAERLTAAGKSVGEPVWRMPLAEAYDKLIDTDAADVKNIGNRSAGSITASQFLQRFVNKVPWAHLDIAGVTWSKKGAPTVPKGGPAFGVRMLDRYVADNWEV